MKICMVSYSFYESDNRVRRYAESLARRGDSVEAIALRRPGQPARELIRGVDVRRIQLRVIDERGPVSYLIKLLLFFFRSAAWLTFHHAVRPYDLIHVHSVPDFQVFAALVPRLAGARLILDIHDIVPELYASKFNIPEHSLIFRLLLWAEKASTCFAHHVIMANHLWRERIIKRSVAPSRCTALINYPDLSIFRRTTKAPASKKEFVLCYPGSLNRHQGLDLAIRAMTRIRKEVTNSVLLIIGDGPEKPNLVKLAHELDLENEVVFRDPVPMEQIADVLASIDVGIVPKRSDSFGNEAFSTKVLEFMAMNVPVVVSNTSIDRFYFNHDVVQFFQSGSSEDLADKIIEIARNRERREALREQASKFVYRNSWEVKQHEYCELVDRLVTRNHTRESAVVHNPASPERSA
jgi:glycosyltransferase involved in cell wall biosynthesis